MDDRSLRSPIDPLVNGSTHRHQFSLSASLLQRGALLIATAIILSSFLAWPDHPFVIFKLIQALLFCIITIIFIIGWRRLLRWQCIFSLGGKGVGTLKMGEYGQTYRVSLAKKPFISPLLCFIYLQRETGEKRLLLVWRDMLDDTAYRNLCRLLLNH